MKDNDKIYLDQEGYDKLLEKIESLNQKLKKVSSGRREAFDAGAGDGWDSPEFEEIERTERMIMGEINMLQNNLQKVQIIDKHNDNEIIDIDDIIVADIFFNKEDFEELTFKLVGDSGDINTEINEVSINSPLGSSVYKKKIGEQASYSVNGNNILVNIKEKLDLEKSQKNHVRILSKENA